MRRWVVASVLLVFALVAWLSWPSDDDVSAPPEQRSDEPSAATAPPRQQREAPRGARISGVVMRDGQPVPNARVSLKTAAPLVTLTLDDGRFLFEDVPSGVGYLAASNAEAASEVQGPFQLVPGGVVEGLTLNLAPSVQISGRVIDLLTQKPIAGAQVVSPVNVARTDADGRFRLTGARAHTWLDVTAPGYLSRTEWVSLELANSGGKLELVLTPSSYLEGTVLESGTAVSAATPPYT